MTRHCPRWLGKARGGFLLPELIGSLTILVVLLGVAVSVLGWFATERRAAERRAWALSEAQNVLERVTLVPYERLEPDPALVKKLGERTERSLPGGRLAIQIDETDAGPKSKRIAVAISWRNSHGSELPPVRLTTWITPIPQREAP